MDKKQIFKMGSSEQNFNRLTISELRKECRNMNPQPAPGVAISGANKDQLIAWLSDEDQSKSENEVSGYAVDNLFFRRRFVRSDHDYNLKKEIREIEKSWNHDKLSSVNKMFEYSRFEEKNKEL